jgi:hypothetical protein
MISGNVVSQAFRYISLRGPGGFLFTTPGNANAAFSSTGRLTPGDYTISGLLNYDYRTQNVTEGHLSLAYSLDVAIAAPPACACDWDVSGGVSSQDFFTFITDFFAGNADFNDSGATNSQDLFDFLGCFFSRPEGCN